MEIIFATGNINKLREVQQILGDNYILRTPAEYGITEDIPETSDSLKGNAIQKAMYIWERLHLPCIADDTGLEVDWLCGAPGVYSARYAGESKSSKDNMNKLLKELSGIDERTARFRCVIALVLEGGEIATFDGVVEGEITTSPVGNGGFGYDPIFKPIGYDKCFSELAPEEKNKISHRGKAIRSFADYMKSR